MLTLDPKAVEGFWVAPILDEFGGFKMAEVDLRWFLAAKFVSGALTLLNR